MYKIGIVGSGADKFTEESRELAKKEIMQIISGTPFNDICIVSGHSPVGGIDIWAEEIAQEFHVPTDIKCPRQNTWNGIYGYKARNLDIAKYSNEVHVILVDSYPPNYNGMKFAGCYHCEKHPKEMKFKHVKSGGCWTGWEARKLNKPVIFHIIESNGGNVNVRALP